MLTGVQTINYLHCKSFSNSEGTEYKGKMHLSFTRAFVLGTGEEKK